MNISTTAQNKPLASLDPVFTFLTPERCRESVLFWAYLPLVLFLANISVGFLNPCFFTKYLPLFALICAGLTLGLGTRGLACGYIFIFGSGIFFTAFLPEEGSIWQIGILFALALNLFILLLSIEEIDKVLDRTNHLTHEFRAHAETLECDYQLAKKTAEEKAKEFEEEIERLKREAEVRRIEKVEVEKKLELVRSEIEWLTSQKEEFIEEAKKARSQLAQNLELIDSLKADHQEREETLKRGIADAQNVIISLQQQPPRIEKVIVKEEPNKEELLKLKYELAASVGGATQLRTQFEEKSKVLSELRKELFQTQGQLIAIEKEHALLKDLPQREEVGALEKDIAALTLEIEGQSQEITYLEELISHILSQ